MTTKRFPGVIRDGATAAAGGKAGGASEGPAPEGGQAPTGQGQGGLPAGCGGPTTEIPGQPADYSPFVGPVCSQDGKAAIVTAYLKGNGEGDTILDPVDFWRDTVSDPGGGLQVKITGGAGYAADAIKVFEGINGTLLLAAVTLVIVLLILIYRSPIFLFIPLTAVIFAELLARSLGYGLSELGVTINGQSSSIMSIMVLGAGTDYALLIVARYREELHHTLDRHEAMAAAMRSAGPAVLASAATVIAALFCLTIAKVNGTSGMGPIVAMGVACAALSMLTLLPALLTIFGRRAFWPFVPHSTEWLAPEGVQAGRMRRRIADGPRIPALLLVIGGSLIVLLLLPLVILNSLLNKATRGAIPSLIVGPLDRNIFKPYELRRFRHEHFATETQGFWARVGAWVARGPRRVAIGSTRRAPAVLHRPRLLLDRPDHERQLHHHGRVAGGPGHHQPALPGRSQRPGGHRGSERAGRACRDSAPSSRSRASRPCPDRSRRATPACSSRGRSSRSPIRRRRST